MLLWIARHRIANNKGHLILCNPSLQRISKLTKEINVSGKGSSCELESCPHGSRYGTIYNYHPNHVMISSERCKLHDGNLSDVITTLYLCNDLDD